MDDQSARFRREELRTVVETGPMVPSFRYGERAMLIGSCFTEHIGNRMASLKFVVKLNPFGIVYNPLSMAGQLQFLLHPAEFSHDDLVFHNDLWYSWMHHGRFAHPDLHELKSLITREARDASAFLKGTDLLVLTFGTTTAYYLEGSDRLVSNCHQLPASRFYTRNPDPDELAGVWIPLIKNLLKFNPSIRICLNISPVRYLKDGPTGNQMNKATLFLLISKLRQAFPEIHYFPSYEIFVDDLRDYRFYDTDMVHPGPSGIEYVWNRFTSACIDPSAFAIMEEVEPVVKSTAHRPGRHQTETHRNFIRKQIDHMLELQQKHVFLDFSDEIGILRNQLESDQA